MLLHAQACRYLVAEQHPVLTGCAAAGTAEQGLFASVHNNCIINPSLSSVSERLSLAKVVPLAVDRAIAEIIFPTVERSVTIGRMTTLELVNKVRTMPQSACMNLVSTHSLRWTRRMLAPQRCPALHAEAPSAPSLA